VPGRGKPGAAGEGRGWVCCCLRRCTRSGRGGTIGRAAGWPASGRAPAGRGAMGVPGVKLGAFGRAGAGRGGMGAPGMAAVCAAGAGPGATTWVGGCGPRVCRAGGTTGVPGASLVRAERSGTTVTRGGSGGKGWRGPAGAGLAGVEPVRCTGGGSGRAGMEILRLPGPAPGGGPEWASGGCNAVPPPKGGRSGLNGDGRAVSAALAWDASVGVFGVEAAVTASAVCGTGLTGAAGACSGWGGAAAGATSRTGG
jgi:DNA polymerase III subunit gamma/tau